LVYAKYIRRNGKRVGPYYYTSVRGPDGKVKSVYLGRKPPETPQARHLFPALLFFILIILTVPFFIQKPIITGLIAGDASPPVVAPDVVQHIEQQGAIRVIVTLKDQAGIFAAQAEDVLTGLNQTDFDPEHTFTSLPGFAGNLTAEGLEKLKNDPRIDHIVIDRPVQAFLPTTVPLLNADDVWKLRINGINITGINQTICIIDTGVNYSHIDLGNCTTAQFLAGTCPKVIAGTDFVNDDADPADDNSHGTHVAGIAAANGSIVGVAPDAKIVAIKVLDASGNGFESDVVAGIDWCRDNRTKYNITVISMSLGGGSYTAACDSNSDAAASNAAVAAGIFVTAASGNSYSSTAIASPACASNITAVAATDNSDAITSFSNTNSLVDLLAPGSGVSAPSMTGGNTTKSGTSMATPHVAGAAALMRQYQSLQSDASLAPSEITQILQRTGISSTDSDNSLTFKRIDVLAAVKSLLIVNQSANSLALPGNGSVTFTTATNLSAASAAFTFRNNIIDLNSVAFPQFNKSATLRLFNLTFQKQPVILRNTVVCTPPSCNATSYADGTFTFVVASFTNYTTGTNANLTIWDQADSGQPFFTGVPSINQQVKFYANYSNRTNGAPISSGNCSINFTDSIGNMTFNASKTVFEFNRSFVTSGLKTYNITCNQSSFEELSVTDSVDVLFNSTACTFPGPNIDWNITNQNVTCTLENILLINQTIRVRNSTFTLQYSNLTIDQFTANTFNFNVDENSTLIASNSFLRSSNASITFQLNITGAATIDTSQITNGTRTFLGGNRTHTITSSIFGNSVDLEGNSTNIITSTTFVFAAEPGVSILNALGTSQNRLFNITVLHGSRFQATSNNTINGSLLSNDTRFFATSTNLIQHSRFGNETQIFGTSNNTIQNGTFETAIFFNTPRVNFTNQSNITRDVQVQLATSFVILDGSVDMPANVTIFTTGAQMNRFYPIIVRINGTNTTVANRTVNMTNSTNGLLSNATTNAVGLVDLNATLNATTFGIGNFSVATNPSQAIGLLTDTPVILELSDADAPNVTLVSPANRSIFTSGLLIELTYRANDTTSGLANCSLILDGALNQTATNPPEDTNNTFIVNVVQGNHTWQVNCTDNSAQANVGSSEVRTFIVDSTPPTIVFVPPTPANGTISNFSRIINVTANDTNLDTIQISVNGSFVANCTSSPCSYNVSTDGNYTYFARANDTAGNTNQTETRTLVIDTIPPNIAFIVPTPANNTIFNTSRIVNVTATDPNLQTIQILVNGSILANCTSSPCNATISAEGTSTYFARANDSAANANVTETRTVTLDFTPPAIAFVSPTPANNTLFNTSRVINVTASDLNLGSIQILVNNSVVATCASSPCNATVSGHGAYDYFARANDTAGNANITGTRFLTIDTIPPSILFVSPTPGNNTFRNTSQVVNATASDPSNISTMRIVVNNTIFVNCTGAQCNATISTEGTHTYVATANDTAGNSNQSETRTLTLDFTPPSILFVSPTPANNTFSNVSRTINVTANDTYLSAIQILVNGSVVATCTSSPCNVTLTTDGVYTYFAVANDSAGNTNATGTQVLTIDTTPPAIAFVSPTPANGTITNTSRTINVTASDTNLSAIQILVNNTLIVNCSSSPCNVTLTTGGTRTYFAVANDTAGNTNQTETRTLTIDLIAPTWSGNSTNATNTTKNGDSVTFTINLSDNFAGGFQIFQYFNGTVYLNDSTENWTSPVTLTETRTITANSGMTVRWIWYFNDTAGNSNQTLEFNLTITNAPPVWTTVPDLTWPYNTNQTLNLSAYVSDPDGDDINWTFTPVTNITVLLNNLTGIVTFVPDVNWSGTRTIVFNATDGIASAVSNNITLTVTNGSGSSGGGGGGGGGSGPGGVSHSHNCDENWQCGAWSTCSPGDQRTRTCTDLNQCNTTSNKPPTAESCTYTPPLVEPQLEAPTALIDGGGNLSLCDNGIQDNDEAGIDCGGPCPPCASPAPSAKPRKAWLLEDCAIAWLTLLVALLATILFGAARRRQQDEAEHKRWPVMAILAVAVEILALFIALWLCPKTIVGIIAIILLLAAILVAALTIKRKPQEPRDVRSALSRDADRDLDEMLRNVRARIKRLKRMR